MNHYTPCGSILSAYRLQVKILQAQILVTGSQLLDLGYKCESCNCYSETKFCNCWGPFELGDDNTVVVSKTFKMGSMVTNVTVHT